MKDARGDERPEYGGTFPDATAEQVFSAAKYLGVPKERTVILDEPKVELPDCSDFEGAFAARRNESGEAPAGYVNGIGYLYSLAGQLKHREGCMELIRKAEHNTNASFDHVILARADMTVYYALPPYCMFDPARKPVRYHDWYYHVTRKFADEVFSEPHDRFYKCKENLKFNEMIEHYQVKRLALHGNGPKQEPSLPLFVTRLDRSDMPNNICNRFHVPLSETLEKAKQEELCAAVTYRNAYNA